MSNNITVPILSGQGFQQQQTSRSIVLWERARTSLTPEVQALVNFGQVDKLQVVNDVLRLAEEKKNQCIRNRLKVTRSNGEVVIVRDIFEKIANFANKFKEIGDVAVQYDPGHASLPWAGIRMLLQIVINETTAFAALLDGLEKVTNCMSRYAIVEALYLREQSPAVENLSNSLTQVYASVLTFLAKSVQFFCYNKWKRILKGSFGSLDQEVARMIDDIARQQIQAEQDTFLVQGVRQLGLADIMTSLLNQVGQRTLSSSTGDAYRLESVIASGNLKTQTDVKQLMQIASDLSTPIHRIAVPLRQLVDDRSQAQRLEILKWASTIPYDQHHNNARKGRIAETGRWLFKSPKFLEWRSSSTSSILWVHGVPGSGKTVLASSLIDEILDYNASNSSSPPIAYFYCSRSPAEPERSLPLEVLSSIARQLSSEDCTLPIRLPLKFCFEKIKGKGFQARRMDLQEVISLIIQLNDENPSIVVIDALDECDSTIRYELLESLDAILANSANVVKVFVTSRDDHDIVCTLKSVPNIYIKAEDNKADIERFVQIELSNAISKKRLLHGEVSNQLQADIRQTLNNGAQGMFRWVSLQLQNLCNPQRMRIEADVVDELGKMPQSLSDVYDVIYEQIQQSGTASRNLATRALQWMMVSQRPLKPSELVAGIGIMFDTDRHNLCRNDLLNLTCNLLVIDEFLDTVRFAHSSVREYLEQRPDYPTGGCNMQVALACLELYRNNGPHQSYTGQIGQFEPLRSYACLYWPVHASIVGYHDGRSTIIAILHSTVLSGSERSSSFTRWRKDFLWNATQTNHLSAVLRACITPFHTCCMFGFGELLKRYGLVKVESLNSKFVDQQSGADFHGYNGLHMAIKRGHRDIVEQLLSAGAGVFETTLSGKTVAYIAVCQNHSHMIDLLARFGANLDQMVPLNSHTSEDSSQSTNTKGDKESVSSPRMIATRLGYRDSSGRMTSALDEEAESPLHLAARQDFRESMAQLLLWGANLNIQNNLGMTPLIKALECHQYGALQFLIERGADLEMCLVHGRTALHIAVASDDITAVQILLRAGADPYKTDWLGNNVSQTAKRYNYEAIAKLLPPCPTVDEEKEDNSGDESLKPQTTAPTLPEIVIKEWNQLPAKPVQNRPNSIPSVVRRKPLPSTARNL